MGAKRDSVSGGRALQIDLRRWIGAKEMSQTTSLLWATYISSFWEYHEMLDSLCVFISIVNMVDSHLSILLGIRSDILDKHETIFAFLFNCLNSSLSNTGQIFEEAFAVIIQIQNNTPKKVFWIYKLFLVWCLLCELFLVES